jgi:hypothetical protein
MPVSAAANEVRHTLLPNFPIPQETRDLEWRKTLTMTPHYHLIAGVQEGEEPGAGGPGFFGGLWGSEGRGWFWIWPGVMESFVWRC